ncbi:MAG: Rho termination factor N-terminal domain-containing protein [Microthrixaceae bacterium]
MTDIDFSFRFHPLFRLPALMFNVHPGSAGVEIDDNQLHARFGLWSVRTPLSNVESAEVTTHYSWPKVIGPAHLSLSDHGLTFATNPDKGVCIKFANPVTGLEPLGLVRHPSLTVTVDDAPALAELLDRSQHDQSRTHTASESVTAEDLVAEASDELSSLTASELRQRAKDRGLTHTSRMNKSQLLELLQAPLDSNEGNGDEEGDS